MFCIFNEQKLLYFKSTITLHILVENIYEITSSAGDLTVSNISLRPGRCSSTWSPRTTRSTRLFTNHNRGRPPIFFCAYHKIFEKLFDRTSQVFLHTCQMREVGFSPKLLHPGRTFRSWEPSFITGCAISCPAHNGMKFRTRV
jgi:hypothetical protein